MKASILTSNTPPVLTLGIVDPPEGHTGTAFTFDVTFTDADGEFGTVNIVIDGSTYSMSADPTDGDSTNGVTYSYSTKMKEGDHTYYFQATDDYGFDANGPCVGDGNRRTFTVYEEEKSGVPGAEAVLVLVTLGIVGAAVILQRRRERPGQTADEVVEEVVR